MKPPGGARGALASGAHRAAGEHDDDSELRALRAVWLEMREEEPSDRGLTDLLAAARAKAETMQARPTLWQRLVGGLGRPSAFALATVMVLVGGAVVLGRRGMDGAEAIRAPGAVPEAVSGAAPGVAPGTAPEAGSGAADTMAGAPVVRTSKEEGAAPRLAPGPAEAKVKAAVEEARPAEGFVSKKVAAADHPIARGASTQVAPASAKPAGPRGEPVLAGRPAAGRAADPLVADDDGIAPAHPQYARAPEPAAKALSPPSRPEGTYSPAAPVAGAPGSAEGASPSLDAAEPAKDEKRADATAVKREHEQGTPAVPLAQLYEQCESAARRGDCAAVRLMVGRITKTDPGYRARVAKDSPVAKCLAE